MRHTATWGLVISSALLASGCRHRHRGPEVPRLTRQERACQRASLIAVQQATSLAELECIATLAGDETIRVAAAARLPEDARFRLACQKEYLPASAGAGALTDQTLIAQLFFQSPQGEIECVGNSHGCAVAVKHALNPALLEALAARGAHTLREPATMRLLELAASEQDVERVLLIADFQPRGNPFPPGRTPDTDALDRLARQARSVEVQVAAAAQIGSREHIERLAEDATVHLFVRSVAALRLALVDPVVFQRRGELIVVPRVERTSHTYHDPLYTREMAGCLPNGMPCVADRSVTSLDLSIEIRRVQDAARNPVYSGGLVIWKSPTTISESATRGLLMGEAEFGSVMRALLEGSSRAELERVAAGGATPQQRAVAAELLTR